MSEWISVKDRLPEKDGEYLIVQEHIGFTAAGKSADVYIAMFAKNLSEIKDDLGGFPFETDGPGWYDTYWNDEYGEMEYHDVTHVISYWMPLPELPVEEVCR